MHDYEYLTVQPGVYGAGNPFGETGDGLELFERGVEKDLGGTEVFKNLLFARRADAGQLVENGAGHLRAPELAVVGVGEAVRLIPDPLQELELGGFAVEQDEIRNLGELLVARF